GEDLETLHPGAETNPMALYYQQLLYEIKQSGNLENIIILSLDKRLLVDYRVNYAIGDSLIALPVNDSYFDRAILGESTEPELVAYRGQYFLTGYTPIYNELVGNVSGVLILESPANFFTTLQYFRQGILYFGLGGLAIIIIFAGIILLAIRQSLQVERRLQQQERLAQLGQMAAMVAHEIRNPLSIIKGSADVLQKKYESEDEELFRYIPEEIDRLNRLVNDFLQFARQRQLTPKRTNPNEQIRAIVSQIKDARIELNLMENCPEIKLDGDAFKQILLNIIENAKKALGDVEDGVIRISTAANSSKGKTFVIRVQDNGSGMSPETLKEIFNPFFTTRATGSGLGMAITKQLVEKMKGRIEVDSKLNSGTTVIIEFPL
ncbi:MAG: nitrogen regulation protein NR(II), partial [Calditrichia bacterium]